MKCTRQRWEVASRGARPCGRDSVSITDNHYVEVVILLSTNLLSISRPPRRLASPFRKRFLCMPTRLSDDGVGFEKNGENEVKDIRCPVIHTFGWYLHAANFALQGP